MSTRALITIKSHNIGVYRHCDGYPEGRFGVFRPLQKFTSDFCRVRKDDPGYFLARLIEHQINSTNSQNKTEGFGVVEVDAIDGFDIDHIYECDLSSGEVIIKR